MPMEDGNLICSFCNTCTNPLDSSDTRLLQCRKCLTRAHPFCVYEQVVPSYILKTKWECSNCKSCRVCQKSEPDDPDLVLCDACDRGFHFYCLATPLEKSPEGVWFCADCERKKKNVPCTTPGCDGKGHLNRKAQTHTSNRFCPYGRLLRSYWSTQKQQQQQQLQQPKESKVKSQNPVSACLKSSSSSSKATASQSQPPSTRMKSKKSCQNEYENMDEILKPRTRKKTKLVDNSKIIDDHEENSLPADNIEQMEKAAIEFFSQKLTASEASIRKTIPTTNDIFLFEKSKVEGQKIAPKPQKISQDPAISKEDELLPRIKHINIGNYTIDTWYIAPYPEEYNLLPTIYLCKFCLKYIKSEMTMERHAKKCHLRHPPGDEIYRDGQISIFEVDGRKNKIYCQNLCLLAKMFLDHKTLYYDVEPFLFYVLTEQEEDGFNFVGYFSKEKRSFSNFNLSCIVTLPCFQGKGYGQLLIDFSYLLSVKEGKPGTPEKPLSNLGLLAYRSYWRSKLLSELVKITKITNAAEIRLNDLSLALGITVDDIVTTLQDLNMLKQTEEGNYIIALDMERVGEILSKFRAKQYPRAKSDCLKWIPFVIGKRMYIKEEERARNQEEEEEQEQQQAEEQ